MRIDRGSVIMRSVHPMMPGRRSPARLRKALLVALALLAVAYAALLAWFHFNEDALLYRPVRGALAPADPRWRLEWRDVALTAADGVRLVARAIPPPPPRAGPDAPWILYFHGSSGNVGTAGYVAAWAKFHRLGLGVFAVDYRGFGESAGTPSEAGLYLDARAAYGYLRAVLHVPPLRIVIYGYSLGSAVAIELATRVPAAALIVEGAFLSIPARGAELYPFVPVALLAHNRFASIDRIDRVAMPKLFMHARDDTVVPFAHGERLFARAHAPKRFQAVVGGHVDASEVDPTFFETIADFVAGLGLPLDVPLHPR